jgi:hypothetical protein
MTTANAILTNGLYNATAVSLLTSGMYSPSLNPDVSSYALLTNPIHAAAPVRLTEGAYGPPLSCEIRDAYDEIIPVGQSATIGIKFRQVGSETSVIEKSGQAQGCTIASDLNGLIRFDWETASVAVPPAGEYEFQWYVDDTPYPFGNRIRLSVQEAL